GLGCRLVLLPMTICSERWLGLGLSLEVSSESNHAFSGIHPFVSSMTDGSQRAGLCRGNFFISKFLAGSFRHLNPFWARLSVCVAERACRLFSVVAAWRSSKRAKPAAWDPPPRLLIQAYSGRFSRSDTLPKNCSVSRGSTFLRFLGW